MSPGAVPVVAFGELLLRLNPPGVERLVQASVFEVRYTGAEANAAAMLAALGVRSTVVSKVPANEIGQACLNYLRRYGIDTSHISRGGRRLGLFYLETGVAQRPSKVLYDRDHSAFRSLTPEEVDWDAVLRGAAWLHFSGTAPAAGPNVVATLKTGIEMARERGVTVSCDLNYRARLWSPDQARAVMPELMAYVDVLIGNEEDAITVFGLDKSGIDVAEGRLEIGAYERISRQLFERFGFRYIATTLRRSVSASINGWRGILFDGRDFHLSRDYEINPIVDRIGGGDAFSGALIFGVLEGWPPDRCVEFAVAASCVKHTIPGDFNLVTLDEVESLLGGDASGRVRR
jgi:2-dehydro-3-deoxygluconokinase